VQGRANSTNLFETMSAGCASEIAIGFRDISSALGSSRRTRCDARCRLLTRFAFVVLRRNLFFSSGFRRDVSR
jgi:hypothetical protein